MIRSCDECGGSGWVQMPCPDPPVKVNTGWVACTVSHQGQCLRCEGMPKLKCFLHGSGGNAACNRPFTCPGWLYPDPDTVMDYCPVHEGFFHWTNAEESFGPRCDVYRIRNGAPEDKCVRVWVAAPTPLEVEE